MLKVFTLSILAGSTFLLSALALPVTDSIGLSNTVAYYRSASAEFSNATLQLRDGIALIKNDHPETILAARKALRNSRLQYKKIEFFLEYFFKTSAFIYNSAPKYEVEEPYIEYQEPVGLQVIEGLLFEKDVEAQKQAMIAQAEVLVSSATDLNSLLHGFSADDKQIMESLRLELIRIYALSISGYDAPWLKSGVEESLEALNSLYIVLTPYLNVGAGSADSVRYYCGQSIGFLRSHPDFDSFDRLTFYTRNALPLQRNLGKLIREMQLDINTTGGVLNYEADHLFSSDAINVTAFPATEYPVNEAMITLGKQLFNETALSGNNHVSCATCHNPANHFTDTLPQSIAFDGHSHVKRNAATLLYAGFQYEQFWDGRAKSLEAQVREVINNPLEMNGDQKVIVKNLGEAPEYRQLFNKAFPGDADSLVTYNKVAACIASFVQTLNPRNSAFDRYMEGEKGAMSDQQKNGFNLFMGKAQCGTCHFIPLFNGLVPPLFNLTEVEIPGTPHTDDLTRAVADSDRGRYNVFPIQYYDGAFKTPTVRNVSATGPYMHNGAFKTLEKVVEFYNKGGGRGLGLNIPNQTLSAEPLKLTTAEVDDVVSFMRALEDRR